MSQPLSGTTKDRLSIVLEGVAVVQSRVGSLRCRWAETTHPFSDISLHDLSLIEAGCHAIADDIARLRNQPDLAETLVERHERQLAELVRLLDIEDPDLLLTRQSMLQK